MSDIRQELLKIPPVTRFMILSAAGITLPCLLALIHPVYFIFSWKAMAKGQLWRLYTSFFYIGTSGMTVLFDIFMLYRNSVSLEQSHYSGRTADYAFSLLLQAGLIVVIHFLPFLILQRLVIFPFSLLLSQVLNYPLRSYVFFRPLLTAITSQWAEANQGAMVSLFGFVNMPASYFPWALMGLDLVQGGVMSMAHTLTGVIASYIYTYLDQIYPRSHNGRRPINTPAILVRYLGNSWSGPGSGPGGFGFHSFAPQPRGSTSSSSSNNRASSSSSSSSFNFGSSWSGRGQRLGS